MKKLHLVLSYWHSFSIKTFSEAYLMSLFLAVALASSSAASGAAVCSWLSQATAGKAVALLKDKKEFFGFCPACSGNRGLMTITDAFAVKSQDGFYSVEVVYSDGKRRDISLSSTFIPDKADTYKNLAALVDCAYRNEALVINKRGEVVDGDIPDQLLGVDVSGYYYVKKRQPAKGLKHLESLELTDKSAGITGFVRMTKGPHFKIEKADRRNSHLFLSTELIKDEHYEFEGEFLDYKYLKESGAVGEEGIQVRGTFKLIKAGKIKESAVLDFVFSVGC